MVHSLAVLEPTDYDAGLAELIWIERKRRQDRWNHTQATADSSHDSASNVQVDRPDASRSDDIPDGWNSSAKLLRPPNRRLCVLTFPSSFRAFR